MSSSNEGPADAEASTRTGVNTYSTGGGGVSFARRVAATYLASMLTGSRRRETGELPVRSLAFQTGPAHPADDLLVVAGDHDIELAVACRATPNFVPSHEETVKLVGSLLDEVAAHPDGRVAVAVAGWKPEWEQVAKLCDLARANGDAHTFHTALETDGRWSQPTRARYLHLRRMVAMPLGKEPADTEVRERTWALLTRLHILGFKVQSPDESDWTAVASSLDGIAADDADGVSLRDRLEVKAGDYDVLGAVVDLNLLRSDTHLLIDAPATRTKQAWNILHQYRIMAFGAVRGSLGAGTDGATELALPFAERRANLAAELRRVASDHGALVVAGSSGTGKSALVLSTVAELETAEPGGFEAVVVNFRELPNTSVELQHLLGTPLGQVIAELSAPRRVLVIDAADAANERSAGLLHHLVTAASTAGMGIVAVAADPAAEFVREQLTIARQGSAQTFHVAPLDDTDLAKVAQRFPLLRGLLRNLPGASLLRRLVVLDLLARTGVALDGPMSEWDCLQVIWSKVVRGDGRPGHGSPQAREEVLLALAAATLAGPDRMVGPSIFESSAVDALRADHLLAPHNVYRRQPQFAHDEVRRYATAICLVRSEQIVGTLNAAGVPRWALSAVALACKGHLVDPARQPEQTFESLISGFKDLARAHGSRWADVPIEAVLETSAAYECLKTATGTAPANLELADVLRVITQRFTFNGAIDPSIGAPVARLLIDHDEPWNISTQAFEVLTSWLQALIVVGEPAGHALREALRIRLLTFWERFPPEESTDDDVLGWTTRARPRRQRKNLDYRVTDDEFVETLALLGPDINSDVEACLQTLAEDAPAYLAPAVDAPVSALSIARHDPELLARLMEAYYIDEDTDDRWGDHGEGIRDHQGRWKDFPPPFAAYWFGGFLQLLRNASLTTSIRVLNNVLNHAARVRVKITSQLNRGRGMSAPGEELDTTAETDDESLGVTLNLTGQPRRYVGDGQVWAWYRGTSSGPYPCMSALQAMERLAEQLLDSGAGPDVIIQRLLDGCENLAVPGMLYGLFARNIEKADNQLDRFLAEPSIWLLEFSRTINEHVGFRASPSDDLAHPERRRWTPQQVAVWLMTHAHEARRAELGGIGEQLVANGSRQGFRPDETMHWAANFDETRYRLTRDGDQLYLEVVPPPEVIAAQADIIAQQEQNHVVLRLQNRYWASARSGDGYEPPTAAEIADDLTAAQALLEAPQHHMRPHDAVAQVVRTAIEHAANGEPEALGDKGAFAVGVVMAVAATFLDSADLRDEGQYFDLGADRSAARALPALLTPALAPALTEANVAVADVTKVGLALAGKAPLETRLFLARGCDIVWASPCTDGECIHTTALAWVLETARRAEIGPWNVDTQCCARVTIEGDVTARLKELDGESIDIPVLDPAIRALGVAAATSHCVTNDAQQLLAGLLAVQRRAMVRHKEKGWNVDHRGTHALVAARALLQSYAADANPSPIIDHLDVLRHDAWLLMHALHGFAAAGAENAALARAAKEIWPGLLVHALTYAEGQPNVYRERTWGAWAAAALLPYPLSWTQGLYNELSGPPIDWVDPPSLTDLVNRWLPVGIGEARCLDALIRLVRKLPAAEQAARGLAWVAGLCIQDGRVTINRSTSSNEWLTAVRATAEEHDTLAQWQALIDALVVAGNSGLAAYST
ncbi:ATP-binding protein [Salinispora arenicola]|uniref:ATP-binding protein n=1 Tax=Salinispora arenicola TaxID=168697 RepID=UPI0003A81EE7|nr:ATP-binding protein [Salinispora arenicola]